MAEELRRKKHAGECRIDNVKELLDCICSDQSPFKHARVSDISCGVHKRRYFDERCKKMSSELTRNDLVHMDSKKSPTLFTSILGYTFILRNL
jgi:hypothetical protein